MAAAFGHVLVGATRSIGIDVRAGMATAAVASLAMAGVTVAGQTRWIRLASNALALGLLAFAVALVLMRLAHETGLVLVAGCALSLLLGWGDPSPDSDVSEPSTGGRP